MKNSGKIEIKRPLKAKRTYLLNWKNLTGKAKWKVLLYNYVNLLSRNYLNRKRQFQMEMLKMK